MELCDQALYHGHVYARHNLATVTFVHMMSVESYLHQLLSNDSLSERVLKHFAVLAKILGHKDCTVIRRLQFNKDLIEVEGGVVFQMSARRFVPCPITPDSTPKISPRSYVKYDSTTLPEAGYAKILGLTITDDLKWTKHVTEIIKKANKRIYFVVQLKRAKVPPKEIITFYCSCVRPVLEYSSEVYHFALPVYLSNAIERVQRRVTSIIFPGIPYGERLERANLTTLHERRRQACGKIFSEISNNPTHKLFNLLPMRDDVTYDLRNKRNFKLPTGRTNRFLRYFIPASIREFS